MQSVFTSMAQSRRFGRATRVCLSSDTFHFLAGSNWTCSKSIDLAMFGLRREVEGSVVKGHHRYSIPCPLHPGHRERERQTKRKKKKKEYSRSRIKPRSALALGPSFERKSDQLN